MINRLFGADREARLLRLIRDDTLTPAEMAKLFRQVFGSVKAVRWCVFTPQHELRLLHGRVHPWQESPADLRESGLAVTPEEWCLPSWPPQIGYWARSGRARVLVPWRELVIGVRDDAQVVTAGDMLRKLARRESREAVVA